MPSSYSPNLRIELIANGEQSGTWGSTTNVNLGTLIEDAVSGYVTVITGSANQALTAIDGAADQSRNMILDLSTSTGSAFNVFIPPSPKVYIVKNSSAQAATIYCSTSLGDTIPNGTGTVVPAGRVVIVFSDGVNVFPALTYLSYILDVASGGTGQSSYTNGQILIGNSTGNTLSKSTLTGTANQVVVTNGSGSITLSLPQSIDTGASVSFNSISIASSTTLTGATSTPTAAEKDSDGTIASTAFVDRLRSLTSPSTSSAGGTLVIGDRGALVTLTGGVTVPSGIFSARDVVSLYNNTGSSLIITEGAGLTLRFAGTISTGNRGLAQRGLATVVFISATEAIISGGGVS
jgi:hypothetical protein